jgi:chromosome segregation ATPase
MMKLNNAITYILMFVLIHLSFSINAQTQGKSKNKDKAKIERLSQFDGDQGTIYYSYTDATRRGTLIYVNKCGHVHILAEPNPDAASETGLTVNTSFEIKDKAAADAYLNAISNIQSLGKRNASVNIIRDQLYRLNELIINISSFNCGNESTNKETKSTQNSAVVTTEHKSNSNQSIQQSNQSIIESTLLGTDKLLEMYKYTIDAGKEIAIAEFNSEAFKYKKEILELQIKRDSTIAALLQSNNKLMEQISELKKKIEALDVKIKELEKKSKANEDEKKELEKQKSELTAKLDELVKCQEKVLKAIKDN